MGSHNINTHRQTRIDHVLTVRPKRSARALPSITAIKQQSAWTRRFQAFDEGREMSKATDLSVGFCCCLKIEVSKGICVARTRRDAEGLEQMLTDQVWRFT